MPSRSLAVLILAAAWTCLAQQAAPPAVVEAVAAVYPKAAVTARTSGSVLVDVHVSVSGEVASAAAAEGDALLRPNAVAAARLWRFQPPPQARDLRLIFSFRLMPKNTPAAQLGAVFRPPYTVETRRASPAPVSHYAKKKTTQVLTDPAI